jgi:hypothetical protein
MDALIDHKAKATEVEQAYKKAVGKDMTEAMQKVLRGRFVASRYTLLHVDENIVAYRAGTRVANKYPSMQIFTHRSTNPVYHKQLANEASLQARLVHIIESYQHRATAKSEQLAQRKAWQHSVKVGDIFYTSWGYEQTNIDWYQVTALIGTKKCELRKIASNQVREWHDGGHSTPIPNKFTGEPMVKLARNSGKEASFKIASYAYAWAWDGKPEQFTDGY